MTDSHTPPDLLPEELERLMEAYLEGNTTTAEEYRLAETLRRLPSPTPGQAAMAAAMAAMRLRPVPRHAYRKRRVSSGLTRIAVMTAAACVAVAMTVTWRTATGKTGTSPECVAYVEGELVTSPERVQSIAIAQLGEFGRVSTQLDLQIREDLGRFADALNEQ